MNFKQGINKNCGGIIKKANDKNVLSYKTNNIS